MKKILVVLLFGSLNLFAQSPIEGPPDGPMLTIEKADGELLSPAALQMDYGGKRVNYIMRGEKAKVIKFEDLAQVDVGMNVFKIFAPNKHRGYHIKAETDTKILASVPLKYQGAYAVEMLVAVLDNDGNILESVVMTVAKKKVDKRIAVKDMVRKHFGDCAKFVEYFDNFDYESDTQKMQIWGFFDMTNYVDCK
ncbi:MAG: hypothetical protein EOO50_03725 [Flavobacterium sp.]|uniref:hypothetical protein n=1 Tax=Flavobacterium sp. TaxID=239 RepID=UPI001229C613|nr:hypothetical protein [Flavobacterium sp.]RZJ67944.1 MAG: hypothetical protein EOO50_03725 [Flavobacterium sp.]